jgi:putative ABC transport system substrate-binding protein
MGCLRRRQFLVARAGTAISVPLIRGAQSAENVPCVGWLSPGTPKSRGHHPVAFKHRHLVLAALCIAFTSLAMPVAAQGIPKVGYLVLEPIRAEPSGMRKAFLDALAGYGWEIGRSVSIVYRSAENEPEFLGALCEELVREKVDVLATVGVQPTLACMKTTNAVPIVFLSVGDPVNMGVTESLARPAINVTGISSNMSELAPKRIELLRLALPAAKRVALLWDQRNLNSIVEIKNAQNAVRETGMQPILMSVDSQAGLNRRFEQIAADPPDALYVGFGPGVVPQNRTAIAEVALKYRVALVSGWAFMTDAGGLLSYSPNMLAVFKRGAYFVDRVLKGVKPDDLPIEQMRTIDLVINLRTAQKLGLTLPPELMLSANRVIE